VDISADVRTPRLARTIENDDNAAMFAFRDGKRSTAAEKNDTRCPFVGRFGAFRSVRRRFDERVERARTVLGQVSPTVTYTAHTTHTTHITTAVS